ncbi:hypothetical protein FNV43_RR04547 [Rhamnella rubrinervis]|uniref:Uncharacterized protein n=1 Tax=Rhamnella rubrinervis TaxID=2594499 RepID=A0A8K0MQP8_9ROSA|nr:hypothetical protein FNV43_RR04547 [Rhamnella rubrinervis]
MEAFSAEDLSKIGGIATVSLLHSFIPTHWLPFSIVGRAQKWTLSRTVLVTAFGAVLHVISTSILGITAVTMANTIAGEETVHKLASLLLVILGGSYILLFFTGKGGHSHSHNQPMEKMAVAGLVLVPALSPCATTLPVFLAVGNSSSMMVLAIIVLLFSTITVMTSLVALSFYGASQLKFHWVERYDKLLVGSVLGLTVISQRISALDKDLIDIINHKTASSFEFAAKDAEIKKLKKQLKEIDDDDLTYQQQRIFPTPYYPSSSIQESPIPMFHSLYRRRELPKARIVPKAEYLWWKEGPTPRSTPTSPLVSSSAPLRHDEASLS